MKPKNIAFLGIMLSIMLVLNAIESLITPLPFMPPQVKPGLSNIITMFLLMSVDGKQAVSMGAAKSLFVFITRGPIAGLLSLAGGTLSVLVMIVLIKIFSEKKMSYTTISISGATAHNLGQIAAAALLLNLPQIAYFLPMLIVSGIVMGILTGALLKILMPVLLSALKH